MGRLERILLAFLRGAGLVRKDVLCVVGSGKARFSQNEGRKVTDALAKLRTRGEAVNPKRGYWKAV